MKPHPHNPRILTKQQAQQLNESLNSFGLIEKPICNVDGTILGGHQRIALLKKDRVKVIDVWMPDMELSEQQCKELCIRLNKNGGEWDWDTLANVWECEELMEWGFETDDLLDHAPAPKKAKKVKTCPHCGEEL